LLTPFLGVTFGAAAPSRHLTYGFSAAVLSQGTVGLEFDAALTPNFFDSDAATFADGNVATAMLNLMVSSSALGAPLRPYVSAGAGILHSRATSVGNVFELNDNQFGLDAGVGAIALLAGTAGLRADIRYFRSLHDASSGDGIDLHLGRVKFWRATLGLSFRF
ncbi:MAG TPA: outer membrane beta-barrel protein, partial [Vicinamibacterales bacterium]|nr:outer membrane beta-barrel protein [Vicinamibacterales bacterium]